MILQDPRSQIQQLGKEAWLRSSRKNTLILPTGAGKTFVAISILKEINPENILLLTNSSDLRDNSWRLECNKWGFDWGKIESQCYQTAFRWEGKHFDFVIADEIDFIAEGYSKFFTENTYNMLLGLTGFITEEKKELVERYAPIVFQAKAEDLQEQNILNKTEFILVEYPLSLEKTIEQKTKTGAKFYISENDQYKYWNKEFQKATIVKTQIEKKYRLLGQFFEQQKDWQGSDWKFKIAATKRKKVLHTSIATSQVTKNLLNHIHLKPNNKVIVFNTLTSEADKLPNPFHGKTEEDISGLERLNSGEINTLSVVKKVTRGSNITGLNYLVRATYDGSETDLSQSLGRLMRLKVGEVAKYLILLPMFEDQVMTSSGRLEKILIETQAFRWKAKMLNSLNNPVMRTIRLGKDLKIKEEICI